MLAEFNAAASDQCTVHHNTENGLAGCDAFTIVGPSSYHDRQAHPDQYYTYSPLGKDEIRLMYVTEENVTAFLACDNKACSLTSVTFPWTRRQHTKHSPTAGGNDKRPVFCNGRLLYIKFALRRAIR